LTYPGRNIVESGVEPDAHLELETIISSASTAGGGAQDTLRPPPHIFQPGAYRRVVATLNPSY
jgi:hypothetical protein